MGRDIGQALQQVSIALGAFGDAIRKATMPPGSYPQGSSATAPYGPVPYGPTYPGVPAVPAQPIPAPMPADRMQWSQAVAPTLPAGPAPGRVPPPGQVAPPGQANGGGTFLALLSDLWDGIVAFLKRVFGSGGSAPPAGQPVAYPQPIGYPQPTAQPQTGKSGAWPAYNPDARAQAFEMFPAGSGLALGFVPVTVRKDSRMIVASGMGRQFKVYWDGSQLFFQENAKPPRKIQTMTSQRQPDGTTTFNITMDNGKTWTADILPDGRTLRYEGYQITLT